MGTSCPATATRQQVDVWRAACFAASYSSWQLTVVFGSLQQLAALQELNDSRLTLVEGSLLSERDLVRLHADTAHAILLLADRFSASARNEDLQLQFQVRSCLVQHAKRLACPINM